MSLWDWLRVLLVPLNAWEAECALNVRCVHEHIEHQWGHRLHFALSVLTFIHRRWSARPSRRALSRLILIDPDEPWHSLPLRIPVTSKP